MKRSRAVIALIAIYLAAWFAPSAAQDKKLERIRIGGGAVGAPQMTMWFAKEANLYEKHGLGRRGDPHTREAPWPCRRCFPARCRSFSSAAPLRCKRIWPAPTPSSSRLF